MSNARFLQPKSCHAPAWIIGLLLLGWCSPLQVASAKPAPEPQIEASKRLHQCAACHGDQGISTAEIFPNLAGQQSAYIAAQLTAFREHTRKDRDAKSYMWGPAAGLSDAAIKVLAGYFAGIPPVTLPSTRGIGAGKAIFERGVAAHGVVACASCHGARGAGNAVIPSLAGQHKDYLRVQLQAFASGTRENAAMHLIAKGLTPREMDDVASYAASLRVKDMPELPLKK